MSEFFLKVSFFASGYVQCASISALKAVIFSGIYSVDWSIAEYVSCPLMVGRKALYVVSIPFFCIFCKKKESTNVFFISEYQAWILSWALYLVFIFFISRSVSCNFCCLLSGVRMFNCFRSLQFQISFSLTIDLLDLLFIRLHHWWK